MATHIQMLGNSIGAKMLLYRGVNTDLYNKLQGKLSPKEYTPFCKGASWDRADWDDSTWSPSEENAVIEHQIEQKGWPTSGVSFTPHIERAKFYLRGICHQLSGILYVVDTCKCAKQEVKIYRVSDYVSRPAIPEDDEYILVSDSFGDLPEEIIIEVTKYEA